MSNRFVRETECRFSKFRICPAFLTTFILGVLFLVMGAVTGNGIPGYPDALSPGASLTTFRSVPRLPVAFSDSHLRAFDNHSVDPFYHHQGNDSGECHPDGFASGKYPVIACHHTKTILSNQDHFFLPWRGGRFVKPSFSLPPDTLTLSPSPVYLKVPLKPPAPSL